MLLHDRAPLEKIRRLADGRIAAVAKFARSGTLRYNGHEVGRPDLQTVTVYRPEDEVFSAAAMASFAHKAVTLGHPSGSVTADNWAALSKGWTEGKVARDGEFIEIPLMLADKAAVAAFDAGTKELSAGYECELVWGDVVTPDGQRAQATQRRIRGNHIALVPAGRAGPSCRLGDAKADDPPKSIDEALRAAIELHCEGTDLKPSEFLARLDPRKQEEFIAGVTAQFVRAAGAAGVAKSLSMDADTARDVAYARMIHDQTHAYLPADRRPAFNEVGAIAASRASPAPSSAIGRPGPVVTDQALNDGYTKMVDDLTNAWRRDRNARLADAYRQI